MSLRAFHHRPISTGYSPHTFNSSVWFWGSGSGAPLLASSAIISIARHWMHGLCGFFTDMTTAACVLLLVEY